MLNNYPYTDTHELNLDWILKKIKELKGEIDDFKVVNNITFSGAWDITKQYPAWTIVSDNNIGYVSIQPVPVGVPLSNGNYWVEVIDYTAQIAGLETRVIDLENTVGDNSSGLVHDVNELQANAVMKKRRFLLFDSYGSYPDDYLVLTLCNIIGVPYEHDSPTITGNHDCRYKGGIGFTNVNGQGTFTDFLMAIASEIDDPDSIDEVIVFGGANDYGGNGGAIETGIQTFITYANTLMPNAKVRIGCLSCSRKYRTAVEAHRICIQAYRNCVDYGAEYLYNTEFIMHSYGMTIDGIHPANDNSIRNGIAYKLANAILDGNCEVEYYASENLTASTPSGSFDTLTFSVASFDISVANGTTIANIYIHGNLTRSDGTAATVSNYDFELAQLPDRCKFVVGRANTTRPYIMVMPLYVYAFNGGNLVAQDMAYAYINEDGDLRCSFLFGSHGSVTCDTVRFITAATSASYESIMC